MTYKITSFKPPLVFSVAEKIVSVENIKIYKTKIVTEKKLYLDITVQFL